MHWLRTTAEQTDLNHIGQQLFYIIVLCLGYECALPEISAPLRGLTGQEMALICLVPLYLTAARHLESLGSAPVGLQLWHTILLSSLL